MTIHVVNACYDPAILSVHGKPPVPSQKISFGYGFLMIYFFPVLFSGPNEMLEPTIARLLR